MAIKKLELSGGMKVGVDVLTEIVRCIVEVAQPDRIILFGSAARGEMGPNSDLDLLGGLRGLRKRSELWVTSPSELRS